MTTEQLDTGPAVFSANQVVCWTPRHRRATCLDRSASTARPPAPTVGGLGTPDW